MDDLFNQNEDQIQIDETKNYLEDLVGDGKKFKTPEELARGKFESDSYIKILEKRLDMSRQDLESLRNEYNAGKSLKELLDQMNDKQPTTSREQTQNPNEVQPPAYKPEELESLVSSKIEQHEQSKKERENYNQVQAKLLERFGNSYKDALKSQALTLGLSDDEVNSMARKNPNLFMKTFDLNEPKKTEPFSAPPTSMRRSDSFAPTSEKRNWNYYMEMYRKDPKSWYEPKISVQMHNDAIALGEDFYK
jgi:hypothetical protein